MKGDLHSHEVVGIRPMLGHNVAGAALGLHHRCEMAHRRPVYAPNIRRRAMGSIRMETSLLQRIARGDRDAVETCVRTYSGLLWSMARRHFRNNADAEEAVQEAFISLWRNASRFDPTKAKEATFVAMIARRRFIDRVRSSRARGAGEASTVDAQEVPLTDNSNLEVYRDARLAAKTLQKLPEDKRQVLWLAIHQGCSHSEIAEQTGLPLGTVKSHFRRGLQAVREMLQAPGVTERSEVVR